jgi:hypothetical protein
LPLRENRPQLVGRAAPRTASFRRRWLF